MKRYGTEKMKSYSTINKKPFGNPMIRRETFDEFYRGKLEALVVDLKAFIKGDIPYATSDVYACGMCKGRIKLHCQGRILCMKCCMPMGLMPPMWSKELKTTVFRIMMRYPSLEASHEEYEALQNAPTPHEVSFARISKQGDMELGKRIREARIAKGWEREDLAKLITKLDGGNIAPSSIQAYENGNANPSKHVLEQIKQYLGLEVTPDVQ